MKMTLQFILSMIVIVCCVAGGSSYLLVRQEKQRQTEELDRRSSLLAESLEESVASALSRKAEADLQRIVRRLENRSLYSFRLDGI